MKNTSDKVSITVQFDAFGNNNIIGSLTLKLYDYSD